MRSLILLLPLVAAIGSAQPAPPECTGRGRFGIRLESRHDTSLWIPAIARARAGFVVLSAPDPAAAKLAQKHGIVPVDRDGCWNIGQLVPPRPLPPRGDGETQWEALFSMTDDSGGTTSKELIRLLIEVAAKGGNLVLSLPPRADGCVRPLEEIGRWLRTNGEAIFGAARSPFGQTPFFGRATTKGNVLYLHLYQPPSGGRLPLPGLRNRILSAELLAGRRKLAVSGEAIEMPVSGMDEAASVIKLTLDGPPRVEPFFIQPDAMGVIRADAAWCEFETRAGQVVRKDSRNGRAFLSHWTRAIDVPSWKVRVPRDGRYAVDTVYSAGRESIGVLYTVTMKGPTVGMVKGIVEATGAAPHQVHISDMELDAGDYTLFVQPENKPGQPAMALEAVVLRRAPE